MHRIAARILSSRRRGATPAPPGGEPATIFLDGGAPPAHGLVPFESLLEQVRDRCGAGTGRTPVPVVVVRMNGLEQVVRRGGKTVAERISATVVHRVRAQLRSGDAVAQSSPTEIFILLTADVCMVNALVVAQRLSAVLTKPVPSLGRRQRRAIKLTVEVARARAAGGRLCLIAGETVLARPVAVDSGRPGGAGPDG